MVEESLPFLLGNMPHHPLLELLDLYPAETLLFKIFP